MKRTVVMILLTVAALMVLGGCASVAEPTGTIQEAETLKPETKEGNLGELMGILRVKNFRKQEAVLPKDYFKENPDPDLDFQKYYDEGLTQSECRGLMYINPLKEAVTKEEMKADIDVFFGALRYSLGRYNSYGGDEVFGKAKEQIIAGIEQYPGAKIPTETVMKYMVEELSFITDPYFKIGDYNLFDVHHTDDVIHRSYTSGIYLQNDMVGMFEKGDSLNRYRACDNENVSEVYLIDENGSIYYSPILYCTEKELPESSSAALIKGKKEIKWNDPDKGCTAREKTYIEEGNIAYVGLAYNSGTGLGKYYSDLGAKAKEKEIVIVDVRHNANINYVPFLSGLSDQKVSAPQAAYARKTMLTDWSLEKGTERTVKLNITETGNYAETSNLVIILTDFHTAFGAETFASQCRMLENAFVVGTSTAGYLDGAPTSWNRAPNPSEYSVTNYTLPNSGIPFVFSNTICTYLGYRSRIGLGFQPDFYVEDTSKALGTVLKLLVKCGLTDGKTAEKVLTLSGENYGQ